jgi:hypothetical protein
MLIGDSLSVQDGPEILHDISFHVKSGEHIGIGKVMPFYSMISMLRFSYSWTHWKWKGAITIIFNSRIETD